MNFLSKIPAEWPLRLGLGLMYLYSGQSLIREPLNWQGFLPSWFAEIVGGLMPLESYLRLQGAGELAIAFLFLAWFLGRFAVRAAAALAVLEMLFILIFVGINLITFRDIGLLGGALALVALTWRHHAYESRS